MEIGCLPNMLWLGIEHTTWACVLPADQTHNLLVFRTMLQPTESSSQDCLCFFNIFSQTRGLQTLVVSESWFGELGKHTQAQAPSHFNTLGPLHSLFSKRFRDTQSVSTIRLSHIERKSMR